MIQPAVLTIAGSDSGGNAGVQADLRAFHAYKLHGCTVFTALTAQNPFGVSAIHSVPADFVASQLDAVLGVYNIKALKTGMLADPATIEVIADRLAKYPEIKKVIDPVMVATSGAKLVGEEVMSKVKKLLFPLATLITPNLHEAKELVGANISGGADQLAKFLFDKYGATVLVKGGHREDGRAVDVLFDGKEVREFELPRLENPISTHGTGCTLASAIAAELALERPLPEAIEGAKAFVHRAISTSYFVGNNCGVLGGMK